MFRKLITKKRAMVLGAVAVLAVAAIAVAYFTSTGSGTGSASVGSSTAFTVAVSSDASASLYPGSGSETLTYKVTNPSAGFQNLAKTEAIVVDDGSGNIKSGGVAVPGCLSTWFHAKDASPAPVNLKGGGVAEGTVEVTMDDSKTNQDECQGKSPEITVKAS